jgi:hypothetical protein
VSDSYIIEIRPLSAGRTLQAGIVVCDGRGFRFFAAFDAFAVLEGEFFRNPKAAEEAVLRCVTDLRSRSFRSVGDNAAGRAADTAAQLAGL